MFILMFIYIFNANDVVNAPSEKHNNSSYQSLEGEIFPQHLRE